MYIFCLQAELAKAQKQSRHYKESTEEPESPIGEYYFLVLFFFFVSATIHSIYSDSFDLLRFIF